MRFSRSELQSPSLSVPHAGNGTPSSRSHWSAAEIHRLLRPASVVPALSHPLLLLLIIIIIIISIETEVSTSTGILDGDPQCVSTLVYIKCAAIHFSAVKVFLYSYYGTRATALCVCPSSSSMV